MEASLANLRAVTDAELGQLDLDDLLVELLKRVHEILDADTAAVLLLDGTSRELVARAAWGLEEEVRQGVRVPLGVGFAGRIAATKGVVRLDRVDATTVSNPILWEKGIRVMLGVPLLAGDDVVGVLHVGRLDDRAFTAEDAELLQVVAERVAGATQLRRPAIERSAAQLLERSLLPEKLPDCVGVDFASRYVPAAGHMVGGDWYDAFTLPSGELWIAIGDVAGHSVRAAVTMGRLKTALRSFALLGIPPHDVLCLVDRKMELFEFNETATVACAVMRSPYDVMHIAIAGHPPPVIAAPGQPATFANAVVEPLLGLDGNTPRSSTEIALEPGSAVVFYTDGLVERRDEALDVGLERLRTAVQADTSNRVAHNVMGRLIGNVEPADDVALLVLHTAKPADSENQ
jgi:putative methionine-R-sulfoxide reductase with GAF domain